MPLTAQLVDFFNTLGRGFKNNSVDTFSLLKEVYKHESLTKEGRIAMSLVGSLAKMNTIEDETTIPETTRGR